MSPLTNTFGYLLVSAFITLMLYGVLVTLTVRYFYTYPKDPIYTKIHVAMLSFLATAQIILLSHWIYGHLIYHFGNVLKLDELGVGAIQLNVLTILLFTAQCFFMYRVYTLSKKNLLFSLPPVICAIANLGLSLGIGLQIQILGHFTRISVLDRQITAGAILTMLCDGATTFHLCYLLHKGRSGLTIRSTNYVINKILVGTLNRGGFSFALTVLYLILYLYSPRTMLFLLPLHPGGQMTTISVLSNLLSRKSTLENYQKKANSFSNVLHGSAALNRAKELRRKQSGKIKVAPSLDVRVTRTMFKSEGDHACEISGYEMLELKNEHKYDLR